MTMDMLRACGRRLNRMHRRVDYCFGRREAREHSLVYLRGILLAEGRKSIEPIALRFASGRSGDPPGQNEVVALQRFITDSPWNASDVQQEIRAMFREELVPSTARWPIGTVGVIDGSSFVKQGSESVGVQRQWCGRLGKKDNCQVGVYLVGVTPAGSALLDGQLYLPAEWARDRARRKKARIPDEICFQTKPQIAADLLDRTRRGGQVRFDWVIADEEFGRNGGFLDALETQQQTYLLEVPVDTTVWTEDPATQTRAYAGTGRPPKNPRRDAVCQVRELAAKLPGSVWQTLQLREGTKGPLAFQFARVRVWAMRHHKPGPAIWLLIRRSLEPQAEVKYYVSNAGEQTSLEQLALVSGTRYRVEEFFEDAKGHLGMADYEARAWTSWHHHMALIALAHLYVTLTKLDIKRDVPELTLDMAVRLLAAALSRPVLTPDDAIALTQYHLDRNRIAQASHRKSWLQRHKKQELQPLL